jgi:ABC-type sugar transport system ATPase subunit
MIQLEINPNKRKVETFINSEVMNAIKAFLDYGEQEYLKSQQGYFSRPGFAARALRWHLEQLKQGNRKQHG